jgi:hypothetical protein
MAGNKLRAEMNQIETKRTIQKINQTRSWFLEKINKIDKLLATLTIGCRDSIHINKISNERADRTTEMVEIQKKKNSDPTTNIYTQLNWKIWIKWTLI